MQRIFKIGVKLLTYQELAAIIQELSVSNVNGFVAGAKVRKVKYDDPEIGPLMMVPGLCFGLQDVFFPKG